jgi:hypothetical protein
VAYLPPTRGTRQCPVSGGVEGAEAGTLSIMVGGEERDVADAWAVLSACGNPVHLGPLGSGQVANAGNCPEIAERTTCSRNQSHIGNEDSR